MRTNQFANTGNSPIMPLLMACMKPSRILEEEEERMPMMYDPATQRVELDMRTIGTKSLKTHGTRVKGKTSVSNKQDRKNEIDDSKFVK